MCFSLYFSEVVGNYFYFLYWAEVFVDFVFVVVDVVVDVVGVACDLVQESH